MFWYFNSASSWSEWERIRISKTHAGRLNFYWINLEALEYLESEIKMRKCSIILKKKVSGNFCSNVQRSRLCVTVKYLHFSVKQSFYYYCTLSLSLTLRKVLNGALKIVSGFSLSVKITTSSHLRLLIINLEHEAPQHRQRQTNKAQKLNLALIILGNQFPKVYFGMQTRSKSQCLIHFMVS